MKTLLKKIAVFALALAMLMALSACGTSSSSDAPSGDLSEADLGIELNGKKYYLREDSAAVLSALGDDYEYSEMVSCVYDGKDKTYTYPGIIVSTVPVDGKDVIEMFTLTDATYTTLRGSKVGDTRDAVIAAYGDRYFDDGMLNYTMTNDQTDVQAERIQFEMNRDTVSVIYIYSPGY